jgi:L-fucose mutarotase/ribose pyranase (RbsD/FucU family)
MMYNKNLSREDMIDYIDEEFTPGASIAAAVIKEDGIEIISDATAVNLLQAIHAFVSIDTSLVMRVCNCDNCKESLVTIAVVKTMLQNRYEVKH